jgi:cbb3-type cytochrome oxidase maturation protein
MSIIYVLIPLSVILMVFAIGFFFWAVRNNQFDDLDTPALDVLDEDDPSVTDRPSRKVPESNAPSAND